MSSWLQPLVDALDSAREPVTCFFRDDDAGWNDERLLALLDVFAERALPVDLAVIPAELDAELARELAARPVGLHQHGLAHVNHELAGRKHEFGPSRDAAAQRRDIEAGRDRLAELLGARVDPIFTPPWNRCTRDTGEALAALGFAALSLEAQAEPLAVPWLAELPVTVDWFAHRHGERLSPPELAARIAGAARPLGVMFHHAIMNREERSRAGELLDVLAEKARPLRMMELVEASVAGAGPGAAG